MLDLLDKSALEQSAALEKGEISAEEMMRATLAQIEAVNPDVNAIVSLRDADELLDEAKRADQEPRRGWMHGMPLAVKDLANAKGLATTMGSPIFQGVVAGKDDIAVARMRAAGAIIIGKTNTPEFGLGSHTFNPVHGVTSNPYDTSRSAGGSSGGAAVALACRMLPVADGSDMMGSLRNPAAWSNVYGFRPSWGRVPSEPKGDSFLHQLATNGPMARTPRDVAALLDTQSGADPRQPHGFDAPATLPGIERDVSGMRVGWLSNWGGAYEMEPGILETCTGALSYFDGIGITVEEVSAPFAAADIWRSWTMLRSWAVAGAYAALYDDPKMHAMLKPAAIREIEQGLSYSAQDIHKASVVRTAWFEAAAKLFGQFDALLLPSSQVWPFPKDWVSPETINGQTMDTYHRWMEVVIPVSLLGLPCLNIPSGFSAEGLPMGLQMFGRRGQDQRLLQIGHAWHQATPFASFRPELLGGA